MTTRRNPWVFVFLAFGGISLLGQFGPMAAVAQTSIKDMLAAQIRSQGVPCDNAVRATRDAKRSKPDYEVWTLQCSNATYRVGRYPDLAAKVERLR